MESTPSSVVIGRARHSETELPYELVLRDGELRANFADRECAATWLSESWEELVSPSEVRGIWVHYKGASYTVYGVARAEEGGLIVYTSSDDRVWLRPAEMWEEHVTVGRYSGPRFRRQAAEA
jgi:hypothetical protein